MNEVAKLTKHCEDNDIVMLGVTTAFELGLTEHRPTAEEIAGELNRVNEWLADPINNLVSRLDGVIFGKKDTILCTENRTGLLKDGSWGPIPMTREERFEVSELKTEVALIEEAIDVIRSLR